MSVNCTPESIFTVMACDYNMSKRFMICNKNMNQIYSCRGSSHICSTNYLFKKFYNQLKLEKLLEM